MAYRFLVLSQARRSWGNCLSSRTRTSNPRNVAPVPADAATPSCRRALCANRLVCQRGRLGSGAPGPDGSGPPADLAPPLAGRAAWATDSASARLGFHTREAGWPRRVLPRADVRGAGRGGVCETCRAAPGTQESWGRTLRFRPPGERTGRSSRLQTRPKPGRAGGRAEARGSGARRGKRGAGRSCRCRAGRLAGSSRVLRDIPLSGELPNGS